MAKYRDYYYEKDGKGYGKVQIPRGDGTYQTIKQRADTKTEARQWALETLRKYGLGEELETPEKRKEAAAGKTFQWLAEWYKEEFCIPPVYSKRGVKEIGLRTWKKERLKVDLICRYFGIYQLDAITADVLRTYRKKRLSGQILYPSKGQKKKRVASITAINREFACMRTMFILAVGRDWMRKNPFTREERLIEIKKELPRVKILNDEIADKLLKHAPEVRQPLLSDLLTVMRWTGGRPSEIYPYQAKDDDGVPREPLCWKNVLEFDFQAVRLIEYKDVVRTERVVPAVPELERCLRSLHARRPLAKPDDFLFPHRSYKTSLSSVFEKAGVGGGAVWSRDFRAYFNNKLIEWKIPDILRLMIIGHETLKTNEIYSSFTPEIINMVRGQFASPAIEVSNAIN